MDAKHFLNLSGTHQRYDLLTSNDFINLDVEKQFRLSWVVRVLQAVGDCDLGIDVLCASWTYFAK